MVHGMHVSARLQGFGATVLPKAPYRIEHVSDAPPTQLRIHHGDQSGLVDVSAALKGQITELADIEPGDGGERWYVETTAFSCAWPLGFALMSDPDYSPFVLVGPEESMIWLAGPLDRSRTSPIEKLATPDQIVRAVGQAGDRERIDLEYTFEGERWWQRRYVVPWGNEKAVVISGQARSTTELLTAAAVDLIEASLSPAQRH